MKRQVVSVIRWLVSTATILLLLACLVPSANAQYRFQRNYQPQQYQQYRPQQYSPYGQPQYQRFQQQPYRYQQYPNQFQQPYRPPIASQPVQPQPSASTNTVTPASVLKYAIKGSEDFKIYPRLSGEFEKQKAVLLSVSDLQYQHNGILAEIVEKSSGHGLRDFGPRFAETESGAKSIDFYYNGQRPLDDKFPISWGKLSKDEVARIKWTLQGGNMQSNGKGFAFVSSRLFEDNAIQLPNASAQTEIEFEKRKLVVDAFKKGCNINQLLVLEPLRPEATKHVDMFATFIAEDTVVVADVDPTVDPQNAKVLKYNVNLLKQVKVDGEPLKIERIKFPPRNGKYWSPYTNIILANNLLLMPVYDSDPPEVVEEALEVYRRLLPDHHVDTVNMTSMQKLEGALHCMSINVPQYAQLPHGIMSMEEARAAIAKKGYVLKTKPDKTSDELSSVSKNLTKTPNQLRLKGTPELVSSKTASKSADDMPTLNGSLNAPADPKLNLTSKLAAKQPSTSPPIVRPSDVASKQTSESQVDSPKVNNPQVDKSQVDAVMTYRRKFIDNSRRFSVDAYAVGLQSGRVLLRQVGIAKELTLPINRLCDEDRQWLQKNENKIRANGTKVKRFVQANGL